MFFENEADRLLKRLFSDPFFGMGGPACDGLSCCGTDNEEDDGAAAALRGPGVRYYGFVATVGPDGRPVVREYGNARPAGRPLHDSPASETREPLVDTIADDKEKVVKIIAEMPGVEKRDIRIAVEGRHVSVSTEGSGKKKYHMRIPLERKVNANSAKATYRNGILQITFNIVEGSQGRRTIRID